MNIIITHARKYDFLDDVSQKKISGIKLHYMLTDDMEPLIVDSNEKGYQSADGTLTLDKEYSLDKVPGVYEAKFVTRVNAKNQQIQKLVDVKYVCTVPELYGATAANKKAV